MTVQALIATAHRAGMSLTAAGDRLRVQAPAGTLTADIRAALTAQKPFVLAVLSRLTGMRDNDGKVPVPCALIHAMGAPGVCFSCGDALEHPAAYGRCVPCGIAVELFYAQSAALAANEEQP